MKEGFIVTNRREPVPPKETPVPETSKPGTPPKTGEGSSPYVLLGIILLSAAALIFVVKRLRKAN